MSMPMYLQTNLLDCINAHLRLHMDGHMHTQTPACTRACMQALEFASMKSPLMGRDHKAVHTAEIGAFLIANRQLRRCVGISDGNKVINLQIVVVTL